MTTQTQDIKDIKADIKKMMTVLQGHDKKFESIDRKFDKIDQRFEGIDRKLNNMTYEIAYIKEDLSEVKENMVTKADFDTYLNTEDALCRRIESWDQERLLTHDTLNNHEDRIGDVEDKLEISS